MKYIDLHVHSTKSDGTLTPSQLTDYAAEKGLKAFALTDHDTTDGIREALTAAASKEVEVIPGIECSAAFQNRDIHILGLFVEPEHKGLNNFLEEMKTTREKRNELMAEKLRERGIDVELEVLSSFFPDSTVTRMHFARYLKEKGYVSDIREAFDRYLGDRACCYVQKIQPGARETISAILSAGGVPILAHPLLYRFSNEMICKLIQYLKENGLEGIEAVYSSHTKKDESYVRKLAKTYGLLISGGSDFHGENKKDIDLGVGKGNLKIPYELLDEIRLASSRSKKAASERMGVEIKK